MADDTVWFKLFSVNVRQAKFELTSRALAARHALQRWVQEQWYATNTAQISRYVLQPGIQTCVASGLLCLRLLSSPGCFQDV